MTAANITLEKTAAMTANNSLSNKTVVLHVKQINGQPVLIGAKEAAEHLIGYCVDQRNNIDPELPNDYLSDIAYSNFINSIEDKVVSWWREGSQSGQQTWYQTYIDKDTNDRLEIDISLNAVSTLTLND